MVKENQAVTFSMDKDVLEKFDKFCEARHLIKSSLVEELIENYMKEVQIKEAKK